LERISLKKEEDIIDTQIDFFKSLTSKGGKETVEVD
jgi:hypothetical protein